MVKLITVQVNETPLHLTKHRYIKVNTGTLNLTSLNRGCISCLVKFNVTVLIKIDGSINLQCYI